MPIMPGHAKSRWLPLSCNRALVLDTLHFARHVPVFPVEAAFDLAEVAALRAASSRRISWPVIFLKAYALVAREHAVLRRAYVRWPWPHLVESPQSVAMLAINRQYQGEERLCFGRFLSPESVPLYKLQKRLDRYTSEPVERAFEKQVQLSHWPGWLRRLLLGWTLHVAGPMRAVRVGTFSLSTLAGQGTLNRGHPTFLTTSLTYGPLDEHGRTIVTLLCDHRVLDGAAAARALADLERAIRGETADELRLQAARQAA
jgi:hypothetical protein